MYHPSAGGSAPDRSTALEAIRAYPNRQRALRSAYGLARYGWPESPATAWSLRPLTFDSGVTACRVTVFLDALMTGASRELDESD